MPGTGCSAGRGPRSYIHSPNCRAPATTLPPHRVTCFFHLRAESPDFCFELATQVLAAMGGAVTVVDEVHGFRFFDNRDLLGFVDGTENPEGRRLRAPLRSAAEDPASPGCYVHVQKYVHDMAAGRPCRFPSRNG